MTGAPLESRRAPLEAEPGAEPGADPGADPGAGGAPVLAVAPSPGRGRGVFCREAVAPGAVLEVAPAIELPPCACLADTGSVLLPRTFVDPQRHGRGPTEVWYLLLGTATLCNHGDPPNAAMRWHRDGDTLWGTLVAEAAIAAGQEVLLRYTNLEDYPDIPGRHSS